MLLPSRNPQPNFNSLSEQCGSAWCRGGIQQCQCCCPGLEPPSPRDYCSRKSSLSCTTDLAGGGRGCGTLLGMYMTHKGQGWPQRQHKGVHRCLGVSREDLLEQMKTFSGTGRAKWIWVPYCKSKGGSFCPKGAVGMKGKVSFQLQQEPLLSLVLHHLQAGLSCSCPAGEQPALCSASCSSTQLCSFQPPRLSQCSLQSHRQGNVRADTAVGS